MYRGKDIGDRERLTQTCLRIFQSGSSEQLYSILPHISVIRSPLFFEPLVVLLSSPERIRKEFAALALGSLGDPRAIEPLLAALKDRSTLKGTGTHSLQTAIIVALGEIGEEAAVAPLLEIYSATSPQGHFSNRRKELVLASLGSLAQQGSTRAERELIRIVREEGPELRAVALTELATAYWHRPNGVPENVFGLLSSLAEDRSGEVRNAALAALSNLADLGSGWAEDFFARRGKART